MSELAKLATDFFVLALCMFLGSVVGAVLLYAVGETVEHFTP